MSEYSTEKRSGCVSMIYSGIFRRRPFWPRRSTSTGGIPSSSNVKATSPTSKRRRGGSDEAAMLGENNAEENTQRQAEKPINKAPTSHPMVHPKNPPYQYQKPANPTPRTSAPPQGGGRKVNKEAYGISGELEMMINDHQRSKTSNNLVRASSGNVMLYGNLGNLRQPGAAKSNTSNGHDYLPKTTYGTVSSNPYSQTTKNNDVITNVARKTNDQSQTQSQSQPQSQSQDTSGSLCRALSTRMDPEQLKVMGNEDFKEGRYAEALALYEAAIAIEPAKAAYRSNKSAALTALGRLLEAVFECREAIKIEPSYHRAHHRLGTLYLRLGEIDKALYHYKQSGPEADLHNISQVQCVQKHLNKCTEAKRLRDWNTLLKVTDLTITSGADSALQIFALKAEALLKLHRHQEADETLANGPKFDLDDCTKFFGPIGNASILLIRAQVDMAAGRFDNAVEAAQKAARLDSNSEEISAVVKRTKGVAAARSRGNELFKASRFLDASVAYGEGLEYHPLNSVLLCNRAACRSKLGDFDKAIEDCNKALNVRPSYSKARLRRADCNAKLERWEASIEDYEVLMKETPQNEEVERALKEVRAQMKERQCKDSADMKPGSNATAAPSKDHFRNAVNSSGTSVVLFYDESCEEEETQLIEQLSREFQSVKFLKVDVDDNPQVAKSEEVDSLPTFRIYQNGSKMEDILKVNLETLENAIDSYCS